MLPQRDPSFYIYPRSPPYAQRGGSVPSPAAPGWFPLSSPASVPLRFSPALFSLLPLLPLSLGEVWVLQILSRSRHLALQWNSTHQAVPLKPTAPFKSEHQVSAETNTERHCPVVRRREQSLLETVTVLTVFRGKLGEGALRRGMAEVHKCRIFSTVQHPDGLVLKIKLLKRRSC